MILNTTASEADEAADQWHKICLLIMRKMGVKSVEILNEDVELLAAEPEMPCIMLHATSTGLLINEMTESEARAIARTKGVDLREKGR